MKDINEDYIYNYLLENEKYGIDVATSYLEYKSQNQLEGQQLEYRMKYMQDFCNVSGLEHPTLFFEIENYREKKVRAELYSGAAVKIMSRGGSVCMPSSLRKSIEDKIKDESS